MNLPRPAVLWAAAASAVFVGIAGCQQLGSISELATGIAVANGSMTNEQAASINRSMYAIERTFHNITPSQEYWIGRTIAAQVLSKYKPYDRPDLNRYVNLLGQSLARFSNRPETFGGYHFLVLDSAEINAFAAPGGNICVTRGLIGCCRNEDALAAVLAHEIGHVELQHGLQSIQKSRITSALTTIGVEAGRQLGGNDLKELVNVFDGSINDITQTLMNSGYSRATEYQADAAAVRIMRAAGYEPRALLDMLAAMDQRMKPGGLDFAKTHPRPKDRMAEVRRVIAGPATPAAPPAREARFLQAMRNL